MALILVIELTLFDFKRYMVYSAQNLFSFVHRIWINADLMFICFNMKHIGEIL